MKWRALLLYLLTQQTRSSHSVVFTHSETGNTQVEVSPLGDLSDMSNKKNQPQDKCEAIYDHLDQDLNSSVGILVEAIAKHWAITKRENRYKAKRFAFTSA